MLRGEHARRTPRDASRCIAVEAGFTLAETVIVIVVLGIISAAAAMFIRGPINAYFDVSRRAQLSDVADTALRRIARDLQHALPSSVRVAGACTGAASCYLEYVPVVAGGRYRAGPDQSGGGDALNFTNSEDTSFDLIGPGITLPAVTPLWLVVYNRGIPGADAYSGDARASDVRRPYAGAGGRVTTISFDSTEALPFKSPARRFQMVTTPVTYACVPTPSGGTLARHDGYGFAAAQAVPSRGSASLLASGVTSCSFAYATLEAVPSVGSVSISLQISQDGETVSLFQQIHVSTIP